MICVFFFINNKKDKDNNLIKVDKEFIIKKVHYYSTANAISNTTNYQNPEWNLKVYQYTDIAVYLDRIDEIVDEQSYITNLSISNFRVKENSEIYYLNPQMFGKSNLNEDYLIKSNKLEYNVINSENVDNEQNYNIPIFFQDCSNPITLRFVNNLADNYRVSNDNTLVYNGGLIRELGLNLNSLNTELKFDLEITTKNGISRMYTIDLEIPIEDENRSILDGDFNTELDIDVEF